MFINITNGSLDGMRIDENHIPYLWDLPNSFSNSFIDFCSCEGFDQEMYQKEWRIKLPVENGGWHESLNLLHVSRCEMLHFVTSYMKQNKSSKQTLESAQYGLEISFKVCFIVNGYFVTFRHLMLKQTSLLLAARRFDFAFCCMQMKHNTESLCSL